MKKQFFAVGMAILAVAITVAVLIHAFGSMRQNSAIISPEPVADTKPSKPPKAVLQPQDLAPEIVEAVQTVLPDAGINEVQAKKDKYKLKLGWGGKTGSAKLEVKNDQVSGTVGEHLPATDMPSVIAAAFSKFAPEGKIDTFAKVTYVGGDQDGQVVYQWDWGNNCDGEASLDGQQITMTDEIPASALPQAVIDAVAKAFPQSTIKKNVQRVLENGVLRYEFNVFPPDGGQKVKVISSAAGELNWK